MNSKDNGIVSEVANHIASISGDNSLYTLCYSLFTVDISPNRGHKTYVITLLKLSREQREMVESNIKA